ncbi:hypothetical protein B484DRAFT_455277 [Ochromonadaceae sp. CCMP2298]|nr:hypothetical protein B484DRAFT_455277 [Ochromonadaceae sp. CCMP2298]
MVRSLTVSVLVHLLLLALLSMQHAPRAAPLTLRLRLPTGMITRIHVDDNSTLADLTVAVSSQCAVQAGDSVTLGEHTYSFADLQTNQTSVAVAHLTRGSLLTITSSKAAATAAARVTVAASPTAESVSRSLDSSSPSPSKRTFGSGSARKRSFSVADIEKHREALIKIKRQPANTSVEVRVAEMPERIVGRVAKSGGVAVLLGRLVQAPPSASTSRRRQKTQTESEVVQVLGALEVSVGGASLATGVLDGVGAVVAQKAQALAEAMGLQVVGCCLGRGNSSDGGMWSAQHIHLALQLRAATAAAALPLSSFVVLSADLSKPEDESAGQARGRRSRRLQLSAKEGADAVVVEAFRLSDQAAQLHERGLLPLLPLPSPAPASSTPSAGAGRRARAKRLVAEQGQEEEAKTEVVVLAGEVIVRNSVETRQVDALLLAVPLPIKPAQPSVSGIGSSDARGGTSGSIGGAVPELQHVFPTLAELQEGQAAALAKQYLLKLLKKVRAGAALPKDVLVRLLDPHLLLFLGSVVDAAVFRALCGHLSGERTAQALPMEVVVALEMVRGSLSSADGGDDDEEE